MKRFSVFSVMLVIFLALGLVMSGCTTTDARISGTRSGSFPTVRVAAKDFTSLGLVFVETVVENHRNRDSVTASGEVLTYYALLQEAQRLGADGIVNVTIDHQTDYKGFKQKLFWFTLVDTGDQIEKWYGSALAIKYGNKLVENDIISVRTDSSSANSSLSLDATSSENDSQRAWYKPWTWFKKG